MIKTSICVQVYHILISIISCYKMLSTVSVLGGDYSSTWPRLLQYLLEITAVLGASTESVSRTS